MQVEISFDSVEYLITISTTNGEGLTVEVEQKSDASRWIGEFNGKCKSPRAGRSALRHTRSKLGCPLPRAG